MRDRETLMANFCAIMKGNNVRLSSTDLQELQISVSTDLGDVIVRKQTFKLSGKERG